MFTLTYESAYKYSIYNANEFLLFIDFVGIMPV